jgi:hypothetical protein
MRRNLFILCLSFLTIPVFAQKLPDVQINSLSAPVNIRVDGKHTEWKDVYAAENKRTALLYSIANDDKNLYLIIKSTSAASANKIMLGGITFVVNTQGKKKEKDAFSVTYPLVQRTTRNQGGRNGGQGGNRIGQGGGQNRNQQTQEQRDSSIAVMRKTALAGVKEIKIAGFKEITDSLISIYNEYGIKTVASFDAKGAFVYELALPLSLLELSPTDGKEFVYQIKVNGMNNSGGMNLPASAVRSVTVVSDGNGGRRVAMEGNGGGQNFQDLMSPTDFWGKYTLIKK